MSVSPSVTWGAAGGRSHRNRLLRPGLIPVAGAVLGSVAAATLAIQPRAAILLLGVGAVAALFLVARTRFGPAVPALLLLLVPIAAVADPRFLGLPLGPLLAVVALGAATLCWIDAGRPSERLGLAALACLAAGSLIGVATNPSASILPSVTLLCFWLGGYLLGSSLARRPESLTALLWLALPIAIMAILETFGVGFDWVSLFGTALYEVPPDQTRAMATFGHPLFAGGAFSMLGLLALADGSRTRAVAAPLFFIAAATTVSRSAVLGIAVGLLVLALQSRRQRLVVLLTFAITILLAAGALFTAPALRQTVTNRVLDAPATELARKNSLTLVREDVVNAPASLLFGDGLRSSEKRFLLEGSNFGVNTFDNQYITLIYEIGLLLLLPLIALIFALAYQSRSPAAAAVAAGGVVLGFANGLNWPSMAFLFWIAIGLCGSHWRSPDWENAPA